MQENAVLPEKPFLFDKNTILAKKLTNTTISSFYKRNDSMIEIDPAYNSIMLSYLFPTEMICVLG